VCWGPEQISGQWWEGQKESNPDPGSACGDPRFYSLNPDCGHVMIGDEDSVSLSAIWCHRCGSGFTGIQTHRHLCVWIYWDPDTKVPVCMQVRKKLCSPYGPAWGQGRTQGRSHSESQRQSSTNWNRWKRNHLKLSGMTKSSAGQQVPMFPARASHPALLKQRWAHLGHTGLTPCPLCSDNTPCFQHVTCMACDLLLLSQSAAYLLY
jgi:hypothetical protein